MNGRRFFWVLAFLLVATQARAVDWFGDPIISPLPGVPTSASVGDLDGQPGLDVAVGSGVGQIWILSGGGTGGFAHASTLASSGAASRVAVGDFDGDGRDDIACADYQSGLGIRIFLGQGNGDFYESMIASTEQRVQFFDVADIDADGKDDLLSACYDRFDVHWGTNSGVTPQPTSVGCELGTCASTAWAKLLVVDTDDDAYLDVVFVGSVSQHSNCGLPNLNGIARFRGQANRQFGAVEWLVVEEYSHAHERWECAAPGDIDLDLDLDFVISPSLKPYRTYLKSGPGEWTPGPEPVGDPLLADSIELRDLDGDLNPDLASSARLVLSGDGAARFDVVDTTGIVGGDIVGFYELDEFASPDILALNRYQSQLHVLPNLIGQDPATVDEDTASTVGRPILTASPTVWTGSGPIRLALWPIDGRADPAGRGVVGSVTVIDLQGRVVATVPAGGSSGPAELGSRLTWEWSPPAPLPAGIYWLRLPGVEEPARIVLLR